MSRLRGHLVPLACLAVLAAAPAVLPDFRLGLLGKFLCFALVALGIDLAWGYTGMLALGQGVFFGLGAYAMGMFLKLEATGGKLPDFMLWTGRQTLPAFWRPFRHAAFALPAVMILPAIVAGALGYLVFRRRIRGVYFALITQALALIMATLLIGQQPVTGGTNGITNLRTIFGAPLASPATQRGLYLLTLGFVALSYALLRWLTSSRYGRLMEAVRDAENRVRFLGYDPVRVKVVVFAVSAALAGLGGALFVPQVGIISPALVGVVPSIEMVVWVAVGGRGTLLGAIVGAVLVNAAKTSFSESFPSAWLYFMGALFVGSVVAFPKGIVGSLRAVLRRQPVTSPDAAEFAEVA